MFVAEGREISGLNPFYFRLLWSLAPGPVDFSVVAVAVSAAASVDAVTENAALRLRMNQCANLKSFA